MFFKKTLLPLAAAAVFAGSFAVSAQAADSYTIDPAHTNVLFKVSHLGFSNFIGEFNGTEGTFTFDPADAAASSVDVTIPLDQVSTDVPKLDEHLRSADFFDTATYPTATFKSTAVTVTGETTGTLTGDLTLHGVTKPVTLDVTFNKAAKHPMMDVNVAGFSATGTIKRTEFGITTYAPAVGDDVTLIIEVEGHHK